MSRRGSATSRRGTAAAVVLLFSGAAVGTKSSDDRYLNTVPMIMAHDAGSGYLDADVPLNPVRDLTKGWTKTQSGGLADQLTCGARVFDSRPYLADDGGLIWHHGGVPVNHSFSESLLEVVDWCGANPSELVIMLIWDCEGADGCDAAVADALSAAGVPALTNCLDFTNLTVAAAMERSELLGGGGHLLAVTAPALPDGGEAACSYSNYVAANGCSGLGSTEEAKEEKGGGEGAGGDDREAAEALLACMAKSPPEDWWAALANCTAAAPSFLSSPPPSSSPEVYHCYDGDTRQAFPMDRLFDYLDATSSAGPPLNDSTGGRQLWQMQALWEETAESVVLGTLKRSSLLADEVRSSLNAKLAAAVGAGRWGKINLLEVNNVCDGGSELLAALRKWDDDDDHHHHHRDQNGSGDEEDEEDEEIGQHDGSSGRKAPSDGDEHHKRERTVGYADTAQRRAHGDASIKIACVGDSITEGSHSSGPAMTYPSQLQALLDAKYHQQPQPPPGGGEGGKGGAMRRRYEVTNLGVSGTTLQRAGDYPYTSTDQYAVLVGNTTTWDIVVVMLGTNDAKDVSSGHDVDNWLPGECGTAGPPDGVSPYYAGGCPYADDFAALLSTISGLGRGGGEYLYKPPRTFVMTPPPLMLQGEYDMNQTVINDDFPKLIPRIQAEHINATDGVVDVFSQFGGSDDWRSDFPPGGCALNSSEGFPPCAYYCDEQSCDQCHPNDAGYAHLAEVVLKGIGL